MNKNKRLAKLEQQYFPDANRLYFLINDIEFMLAYDKKYGQREESAPA